MYTLKYRDTNILYNELALIKYTDTSNIIAIMYNQNGYLYMYMVIAQQS